MSDFSVLNPDIPGHLLELKAQEVPEQEVLIFENNERGEVRLNYRDIYENSNKIARLLLDNGIGSGDTFAVYMKNYPEFVYALIAASTIGAIMVPVDPRTIGERLEYLINDSKARAIITAAECADQLNAVIDRLAGVKFTAIAHLGDTAVSSTSRFHNLSHTLKQSSWLKVEQRCFDPRQPLEIIYTSGTTGHPKGVVIRTARVASFRLLGQAIMKYESGDILYSGLSLTHGNAQAVTLFPALMLGLKAVFSPSFTRSRIWDICRKYGCTTFSLLGGMMAGIANLEEKDDDADNPVRMVVNAGTPAALWEDFEKRFNVKILEWYGAVEGGLAYKPIGVGPIGSFGKPIPGVMEFKVVDDADNEVPAGVVGELISRMVQGETKVDYHGKPGASNDKTRGGWLRSGDMVHVDEEGWFFFDYRKGGGLRRSGDFIQPEFVETVIGRHPEVSEVCVYGIPAASGAPGESDIVAALAPFSGQEIDPKAIYNFCQKNLEKSNIPSFLQVVAAIPKTVSEKHQPRLLKEQFTEGGENIFAYQNFK